MDIYARIAIEKRNWEDRQEQQDQLKRAAWKLLYEGRIADAPKGWTAGRWTAAVRQFTRHDHQEDQG